VAKYNQNQMWRWIDMPSVTTELLVCCEKLGSCLPVLSNLTFDYEILAQEKPCSPLPCLVPPEVVRAN
jgi:hypothetical protein